MNPFFYRSSPSLDIYEKRELSFPVKMLFACSLDIKNYLTKTKTCEII